MTAPAASPVPPSRRLSGWLVLGIYLAVLAAYFPALRGGLVWDDDAHVTRADLRSLPGLGRIWFEVGATQQYYPVVHTAFWAEHRLWGDATLGYHLTNVLLHATAACLFALLLVRLGVPGAGFAALLFALHPVGVESVAWISEQKNTLSAVFYLLAALGYLRFDRERTGRRYVLALGCFGLALLTKSVTATLPAALLVVLWWRRGRIGWRRDVLPLVPWLAIGAVAGLFTAWVERAYIGAHGAVFELGLIQRGLLAGRASWFYLGKLAWPAHLVFIYPRWPISASAFGAYLYPLALVALLALLLRTRAWGLLAGMLFFLGSLFPALGFFNVYPFIYSFVADHFQYLASLGVFALAAAAWSRLPAGRIPLAVLVLGALAVLTWRQSRMYRDLETLYRETIRRNPESWMAYSNLGTLLLETGRAPEAMADLERAVALKPDLPEGQFNLGNALRAAGRLDEAVGRYEAALRARPDYPEAEDNLGTTLAALGRPAEAILHVRAALRLRPRYPEAEVNLGTILQPTRPAEAIACFEAALRIDPDDFAAHYNLGIALRAVGRLPASIAEYEAALRLQPRSASAENNLGVALVDAGRGGEAIAHYQAALRISPANAEIENNLGIACAETGRLADAIAHFRHALVLRPGYRAAHYNLSLALRDAGRPDEAQAEYRQALQTRP